MGRHKVGIIMGSDSDLPVMKEAIAVLEEVGIVYDVRIISAHRTPEEMLHYAKSAKEDGCAVIIAGAGGAAHLPGMTASMCSLPVIGVPVKSRGMAGVDSVLSILQMPAGIPVATAGLDNAKGAAKLAVRMLHCFDNMENKSIESSQQLNANVKILCNETDVTGEDLTNVIETLAFYGLKHEIIDITMLAKEEGAIGNMLKAMQTVGDIAILNLTNLAHTTMEELYAVTTLPIISVPIKADIPNQSNEFKQALQTVEDVCNMSNEIKDKESPLALLAVNGYQNAGIMLARIAGIHSAEIFNRVANQLEKLREMVIKKDAEVSAKFSGFTQKYENQQT